LDLLRRLPARLKPTGLNPPNREFGVLLRRVSVAIPLICLIVLYYVFLLVRIFVFNRRKSSIPEVEFCRKQAIKLVPLTLAPIVRVVMDFGREWGRLQGLTEDMRNND